MGKCFTIIGLILSVFGTILTLWTTFITSKKYAGTWKELASRNKSFPKEKSRVIFGCILISIGGLLQIIGQLV